MKFGLNEVFIFLIFAMSFLSLIFFKKNKLWIFFSLNACFILRMILAIILNGGLKYVFVIDSLNYEYKGWLIAQPWMSEDLFMSLTPGKSGQFNYYEIFLSWVFRIFGQDPLVATLFNCVFSTMAISLLCVISIYFLTNKDLPSKKTQIYTALFLVIPATFYPSFLVWSTTNNRDPLYFMACILFFLCFFTSFSAKSSASIPVRLLGIMGSLFSIWLVLGIRSYVNWLFLVSVISGIFFYLLSRKLSWRIIASGLLLLLLTVPFLFQATQPELTTQLLSQLESARIAFANLNLLDSIAKSSFGLDQHFTSIFDVLSFLPSALLHYFFGPFPWEISSMVQLVSLLETFIIYLLTRPTLVGIRRTYRRAPFETITLLSFILIFSISQSLVISNMGTIFRHRTLPFLFLLIFTSEGLNEIAKKNFPSFFKT